MRIFLAGATGVIGTRLVPLLVAAGHKVAGTTRSPAKAATLRAQGAEPVVCDAFDADALQDAVVSFGPELVMHQLTDLPDDAGRLPDARAANARMRETGTRNLLQAARAAGATRFAAQSVAWQMSGDGLRAKEYLESSVLAFGGVVLRYGQFYGPGTFYADSVPPPPRVHIDAAARRTVPAMTDTGIVEITE